MLSYNAPTRNPLTHNFIYRSAVPIGRFRVRYGGAFCRAGDMVGEAVIDPTLPFDNQFCCDALRIFTQPYGNVPRWIFRQICLCSPTRSSNSLHIAALHFGRDWPKAGNSHFATILVIKLKADLNPEDFSVVVVSYLLND
jgi:hypothetical protein